MHEDLAPVVQRGSFARNRYARRKVLAELSDMADDLVASGFHNDGKRAGSFHFVGALLVLVSAAFVIFRIPGGKGTYADTRLPGQMAP